MIKGREIEMEEGERKRKERERERGRRESEGGKVSQYKKVCRLSGAVPIRVTVTARKLTSSRPFQLQD